MPQAGRARRVWPKTRVKKKNSRQSARPCANCPESVAVPRKAGGGYTGCARGKVFTPMSEEILFLESIRPDWIYQQSTGHSSYQPADAVGGGPPAPIGTEYPGTGEGRNNPAMQDVPDEGPIHQGAWNIGPGHYSSTTGPMTMNLMPLPGPDPLGRDLFRMHGDNAAHDASEGCPIFGPGVRNRVNNSSDRVLRLIP